MLSILLISLLVVNRVENSRPEGAK
jgi:hypothetical protein